MFLKACLNGDRAPGDHPALPVTVEQLCADAVACRDAGAAAIHLHPRDGDGRESLDVAVVDLCVRAVRAACGLPVGVATGAWVEPDPDRRAALVAQWREPDFASVNLSEPGWEAVARTLLDGGHVGVEAGVWSAQDAERLNGSGLTARLTRILVEIMEGGPAEAEVVHCMLGSRPSGGPPLLQHGEGDACWPVLRDALARGLPTRIGLEDTLVLPDGAPAPSNAALVAAAVTLAPT